MNSKELISYNKSHSFTTESFRTLRANLQFLGVGDAIKTVMLAGGGFGEGTSFITANLGIVLAQAGKRVIIVDCDLRKPRQHLIFNLGNEQGLTSILSVFKELKDVLKNTPLEGLSILTSGLLPTNPTDLLGSQAMGKLIDDLKEKADVVLLDTSPLTVVADAAVLSKLADGVLIVVRAKVASYGSVIKTKEFLDNAKAKILGVAFNSARLDEVVEDYYSYYSVKVLASREKKR
ncbi:MAG: CpsD/CapB family tyrosine-protein kinase [Eubacteriales bacterium]